MVVKTYVIFPELKPFGNQFYKNILRTQFRIRFCTCTASTLAINIYDLSRTFSHRLVNTIELRAYAGNPSKLIST